MAFTYKPKDGFDLCHFTLASEKEYGVQVIILNEKSSIKEVTEQHYNTVKTLFENRVGQFSKKLAFIQVAPPAKGFEPFDKEKYKIVIIANAYFKLLEFFKTEWPIVQKRFESDFKDLKSNREWMPIKPFSISFRGEADVAYKLQLDATSAFTLDFVATKHADTGKFVLSIAYSSDVMGSLVLPLQSMVKLAQEVDFLKTVYNYKETQPAKKIRHV